MAKMPGTKWRESEGCKDWPRDLLKKTAAEAVMTRLQAVESLQWRRLIGADGRWSWNVTVGGKPICYLQCINHVTFKASNLYC